jgi:hypothetical protein
LVPVPAGNETSRLNPRKGHGTVTAHMARTGAIPVAEQMIPSNICIAPLAFLSSGTLVVVANAGTELEHCAVLRVTDQP